MNTEKNKNENNLENRKFHPVDLIHIILIIILFFLIIPKLDDKFIFIGLCSILLIYPINGLIFGRINLRFIFLVGKNARIVSGIIFCLFFIALLVEIIRIVF